MKRLSTYTAVLLGVITLAVFLGMYYVLGQEIARQLANIILLGTAVTISVGWVWAAIGAFKRGVSLGRDLIIVTVWLSWTALLVQRIYTICVESLGRPDWLTQSPGSIIVAVLIMVSGIYAIVAPITDPEVLSREKIWDKFAIIMGVAVSVVVALGYYIFRK